MAIKRISVIGGDLRQAEVAKLFSDAGYEVTTYGMKNPSDATIQQASDADVIIFPMPVCIGKKINAPFFDGEIYAEEILDNMSWKTIVLGGKFPDFMKERMKRRNIIFEDYLEREELAIKNAEATAEGALEIAIRETPITINESRSIVTGWGRIAKFMALMLRSLGSEVTIYARKLSARAEAQSLGFKALDISDMKNNISGYDIIINTVPAMLFDEEALIKTDKNTLIIDLASKPGGVDFEAADALGIQAIQALGLPGKTAYRTAGKIIYEAIENILSELEV